MILWLLNILSKFGIHNPSALTGVVARTMSETSYTLIHDESKLGIMYIQQEGGQLGGMVLYVDYKTNASLEDPIVKIYRHPNKCYHTYQVQKEQEGSEYWDDLNQFMVYGVVPVVMEQCRNHIMAEMKHKMGI